MLPGHFYSADDFQQPSFCSKCGLHTPKTVLNTLGGRCANCSANVDGGQNSRKLGATVFLNIGLVCLVLGLCFFGYRQFVLGPPARQAASQPASNNPSSAPSASPGGDSGPPTQTSSVPTDLVENLKNQGIRTVNDAFGADTVTGWNVSDSVGYDNVRHAPTVSVGGQFPCVVEQQKVTVSWNMVFIQQPDGKWVQDRKEAWYSVPSGAAQFDWDTKQFVRQSR